ncbi:MAG: 16S rRNA (cytosine(1402)-N(4))-methyltransferase RsmH [Pseudomonadota bacterium]
MIIAPVSPHVPVLLQPLLNAIHPVSGCWLDGTFGAGGYTRALLEAGADQVIAIDRDPQAIEDAKVWTRDLEDRLILRQGRFSQMAEIVQQAGHPKVDGVVLDIGVSSMQIDQGARGFSFQKDGPLDMRMEQSGLSAADLVNTLPESELADILFQLGEERASRRIARAITIARGKAPLTTTRELASVIAQSLPRPRPGQPHPATRSFQALRIAVNRELEELAEGLMAAEAILNPGGWLAVVTFHSLEDRIVKRFLQERTGSRPRGNRHLPDDAAAPEPRFARASRQAIAPSDGEIAANPRSRSAKLRLGRRLDAPAERLDLEGLGLPPMAMGQRTP